MRAASSRPARFAQVVGLLLCGAGCSTGVTPADPDAPGAAPDGSVLDARGSIDGGAEDGDVLGADRLEAGVLDVPAPEDAAGPRLELGEGETVFRPIADGDTLLLARGCQGSQHVWISLRAHELVARGTTVGLELARASDGVRVSADFLVRISFADDPAGFAALHGLTLQIPSPDPTLGIDLILRGTVEDTSHRRAIAERRVRIEWGTEVCGT